MAISEAQNKALKTAADAAKICLLRAGECDRLGLGTLAREWNYFGRSMAEKIEMQKKALEEPVNESEKYERDGPFVG
jgi:hypothetical protein